MYKHICVCVCLYAICNNNYVLITYKIGMFDLFSENRIMVNKCYLMKKSWFI